MATKQELEVENQSLKVKIQELESKVNSEEKDALIESLLREVQQLGDQLLAVNQGQLMDEADPLHQVFLDGKVYKILLVETVKELGDQMRKGLVEEDRTVVVIDRHGA